MTEAGKLKFNNAKYQHRIHLKFFPSPQQAIYGLLDSEEKIVYVGSSDRVAYRLAQHLKYNSSTLAIRTDLSECTWIIIEEADGLDETELSILEQHYHDMIHPTLNCRRAITISRMNEYFKSLEVGE